MKFYLATSTKKSITFMNNLKNAGEITPEIYEIDLVQRLLVYKYNSMFWNACRYLGLYLVYLSSICMIRYFNHEWTIGIILFWTILHVIIEMAQVQGSVKLLGSLKDYIFDIWQILDLVRIFCQVWYLACAFGNRATDDQNALDTERGWFCCIMVMAWVNLL
jgi:hypothetical protein